MKKFPQITLAFWIATIAATTLGETAGDLLAQTMRVGYAVSSMILIGLFLASLVVQLRAKEFRPVPYWTVILVSSTAGTTISDFMDRSAGLGYAKGSMILVSILVGIFVFWRVTGQSSDVSDTGTIHGEILYWTAILVSNTLGTALGDFLANKSRLGFLGSTLITVALLMLVALVWRFTPISNLTLFWIAFVLTRPFGATTGDFLSKPIEEGGLGYGTTGASVILVTALVSLIVYSHWAQRVQSEPDGTRHRLTLDEGARAGTVPPPTAVSGGGPGS